MINEVMVAAMERQRERAARLVTLLDGEARELNEQGFHLMAARLEKANDEFRMMLGNFQNEVLRLEHPMKPLAREEAAGVCEGARAGESAGQ